MGSEVAINVSVEAAIHKGLAEFAQHIHEEYGVLLETAEITWGYSGLDQKPQVSEAIIRTRTVYGTV